MGSKFKILCLQETSWNSLRTAPRDLRLRMGKALGALWASAHQQVSGQQPRQNFGTGILTRFLSAFSYENFGVRVGYGTIGEEIHIDSLTTSASHGGGGGGGGGYKFPTERTVLQLVISDAGEMGDEICGSIVSHIILENLDTISTWIESGLNNDGQKGLIINGLGRSIHISALLSYFDGDARIDHCFLLAERSLNREAIHGVLELVQRESGHVDDITDVDRSSSVTISSPIQVSIRLGQPFLVGDYGADFVMRVLWSLSARLRHYDLCALVDGLSSASRRSPAPTGLSRSLTTRRVSAFELLNQRLLADNCGADFVMREPWSPSTWLRHHCLSQAAIEQAALRQPENYEHRIARSSRRLRKQIDVVPPELRPLFCVPKSVGTQAFMLLVRCASLGDMQGADNGNGLARSAQDMVTSG